MCCHCWTTGLVLLTLVDAAHAAPPADGPATLAPAERALVEGAPAQAAAIAAGVLHRSPNDLRALKIVGTASCLLRDPVTALQAADRLPRIDRLLLEELCAKRGVVLEPRGVLRTHPLLGSPLARRLYAEGVLAMERGEHEAAERLLQRAHRAEADPQILFEVVRCQVRGGKLRRAMATHRRYVAAFRTPAQRLAAAARFGELL